jgi:hypothetical protein
LHYKYNKYKKKGERKWIKSEYIQKKEGLGY